MKKRLFYPIVILMIAALVACNLPTATDATPTSLSIDAAFTAAMLLLAIWFFRRRDY